MPAQDLDSLAANAGDSGSSPSNTDPGNGAPAGTDDPAANSAPENTAAGNGDTGNGDTGNGDTGNGGATNSDTNNNATYSDSWNWGSDDAGTSDPLVLNLAGGQVHTTGLDGSTVSFDMQGNGNKVKTAWITPDEGFLVRDTNGDGTINSIAEMFSEKTSGTAATGFVALGEFDSNHDGKIDAGDAGFSQLKVWINKSVDGISSQAELYSLDQIDIASIDLHKTARNLYDNGNVILSGSSFTRKDGTRGDIAEALFTHGEGADVSTVYITDQSTAVRLQNGRAIEVLTGDGAQNVNATRSGVNVLVGGQGDLLNAGASGNTILVGNGGATLNGNGGATSFIVNGSANAVTTGSGKSSIRVNGDRNTVNASQGTASLTIAGNSNQVTLGSNDTVTLGGSGNTVAAAADAAGDTLTVSGTKQVITVNHAALTMGDNSAATITGSGDTVNAHTGGTVSVIGGGNIIDINFRGSKLAAICDTEAAKWRPVNALERKWLCRML